MLDYASGAALLLRPLPPTRGFDLATIKALQMSSLSKSHDENKIKYTSLLHNFHLAVTPSTSYIRRTDRLLRERSEASTRIDVRSSRGILRL